MREVLMSVSGGILYYLLITQIVQCFTDSKGGVPEDEAEDENAK